MDSLRVVTGHCYLFIKTIERAHLPKDMWEKIKLPRNYAQALALLDKHLAYWPNFIVHKAKQRLTKIHQMLIRMRKLKLQSKCVHRGVQCVADACCLLTCLLAWLQNQAGWDPQQS